MSLRSIHSRAPHGVGDDREEVDVSYGAGGPLPDLIQTGNGGNPYTESGWTGWYALDTGFAVAPIGVLLSPCAQTGVLALSGPGLRTAPPVEQCETETDVAPVRTQSIGLDTAISMSSDDNRAPTPANPNGALVKLTIALGEPDSVAALSNELVPFAQSGQPACTADLQAQKVICSGLLPGERYALLRHRGRVLVHGTADQNGLVRGRSFTGGIMRHDLVTLINEVGRTLTTLHVADLRVSINGSQTVIASGSCEPGDFYGPPLSHVPTSHLVGVGVAGDGTICPLSGRARGLSAGDITQIDDLSGGQTRTEVPALQWSSPSQGATLYGDFTALAAAGLPGPHNSIAPANATIALSITPAAGGTAVFTASNVATSTGAPVGGLAPGAYVATWVITDANGDQRTVRTHFVEVG